MSCHLGTKRYEALMSSIVYKLFATDIFLNPIEDTEAPCFVGQLPVKLDAVRREQ